MALKEKPAPTEVKATEVEPAAETAIVAPSDETTGKLNELQEKTKAGFGKVKNDMKNMQEEFEAKLADANLNEKVTSLETALAEMKQQSAVSAGETKASASNEDLDALKAEVVAAQAPIQEKLAKLEAELEKVKTTPAPAPLQKENPEDKEEIKSQANDLIALREHVTSAQTELDDKITKTMT